MVWKASEIVWKACQTALHDQKGTASPLEALTMSMQCSMPRTRSIETAKSITISTSMAISVGTVPNQPLNCWGLWDAT